MGLLVLVSAVLGLLGGAVLLPQLGAVGWVAVGLVVFLAVQLAMFRLLGLRSQADEDTGPADSPPEEDVPVSDDNAGKDWRAWRG